MSFHLRVLEGSFQNLPVSDMIFHPEDELSDREMAAEIVRCGREGRAILL